jgi:predicted secreted protein
VAKSALPLEPELHLGRTADLPARFDEVIERIMAEDVGTIQLPCPERACLKSRGVDLRMIGTKTSR